MRTLLITNKVKNSTNFICSILQKAWNKEAEEDKRKKKETYNFLSPNENFKIISSKTEFEIFNFEDFKADIIFIVPELLWDKDSVNEGYNLARELITHTYKSECIQLVFLTVLDKKNLLKIVDTRNKSFVEAFPHICLLDDEPLIKFNYYSEVHYKLIKHLAISDHGRLQKIGHEMSSVKANVLRDETSVEQNKAELLKQLDELALFQAWLSSENISDIINEVNVTTSKETLKNITQTIDNIIEEVTVKLPKENGESVESNLKNKSSYKVFIVEDEIEYRRYFYNTLSKFYQDVYPDLNNKFMAVKTVKDFAIERADEIIKQYGKNYQIFLLDLLYKDKQGNWLNFNGLDLYQLIRKVNPYAVIRIITSLPRGIVAKVVEVILSNTEKPNTDQVFTKKYGFEALKDSIIESIEKINQECGIKEKTKTVWLPFPKKGPFEWNGVKNYIYELLFNNTEEFESIKNNAENLFNKYLNNSLTISTSGWDNGMLLKPAQKDKGDNVLYIKGKLNNILVHRLIVLSEALRNDDLKVNYYEFQIIISKYSRLSNIDKGYFHTKLGFNGEEIKINEKDVEYYFKIKLKNLFPHEQSFIAEQLKAKSGIKEDAFVKKNNPELDNWFKKIFCELTTYENWDELHLDFNPYENQLSDLDNGDEISPAKLPDFTIKNFRDFLFSLNNNYFNPYVQEIVLLLSKDPIDGNKIRDNVIATQINLLFDKD